MILLCAWKVRIVARNTFNIEKYQASAGWLASHYWTSPPFFSSSSIFSCTSSFSSPSSSSPPSSSSSSSSSLHSSAYSLPPPFSCPSPYFPSDLLLSFSSDSPSLVAGSTPPAITTPDLGLTINSAPGRSRPMGLEAQRSRGDFTLPLPSFHAAKIVWRRAPCFCAFWTSLCVSSELDSHNA